jgi:hypothetical protein
MLRPSAACATHELQGLLAAVAGAVGGRVAAMPADVRIQEIADGVEVAVQDGFEAPASELNVAHGHPAIVAPASAASQSRSSRAVSAQRSVADALIVPLHRVLVRRETVR